MNKQLNIRVLTVNTHKGFTIMNRRFVLPELRDAVRAVNADVVFLQEVQGIHEHHSKRILAWPEAPHYEFLADEIWPQYRYGQNAVYPEGHHGNALLSKLPIVHHENRDVTVSREEKRGLLHCVLQIPEQRHRRHFVKATVRVHAYPDGRLAVFHGPRRLADYEPDGTLIDQISPARTAA